MGSQLNLERMEYTRKENVATVASYNISASLEDEAMTDFCICPDCDTKLKVAIYGHNLACSECGCRLDVFPESAIRVDTPVGVLFITLPLEWRL